ncbi:MAG: FAD-binding oxidoreductase [Pseudomonadales bacterium]
MSTSRLVVIGGGVMGSAVAYFLTRDPRWRGRLTIIERDPTFARASSSLSASGIRQQFSTPVSIAMSRFGFEFVADAAEVLRVDLGLTRRGYLILASAEHADLLAASVQRQRAQGAEVALLGPSALAQRFPWLNVTGIGAAGYGTDYEGWFDGPALHRALLTAARGQGAQLQAGDVVALERAGAKLSAVLGDGARIEADLFVLAAGAWSGTLAATAGVDLPVAARKRQVFVFRTPAPVDGLPMLFDPSGVWCRPEGPAFLCGRAPRADEDPDDAPLEVHHQQFDEEIWPVLAQRVPGFEALRVTGAWAGYYEYCTFDQNGIVGSLPGIDNLLAATGFSGHGMQHAPAVGRGIAELVLDGGYRSLDLSDLGYARIAAGRPIREQLIY